jgi:predicted nuclease of predicted toxin-antitoxin system
LKVKLFLDEDVHAELAHALRNRGFDAVHAQELARKGKTDREQLDYAIQEQRCVVTFNVKDFVVLHNDYIMEQRGHWGIIVSTQLPLGETMKRLLRKLQSVWAETMQNKLEFL